MCAARHASPSFSIKHILKKLLFTQLIANQLTEKFPACNWTWNLTFVSIGACHCILSWVTKIQKSTIPSPICFSYVLVLSFSCDYVSFAVDFWNIQLIRPTLHALKCEHYRYTCCYMFRHFLSAIIRKSLYQLNVCPSNSSVMWCAFSH
jgi:hypothetical protein